MGCRFHQNPNRRGMSLIGHHIFALFAPLHHWLWSSTTKKKNIIFHKDLRIHSYLKTTTKNVTCSQLQDFILFSQVGISKETFLKDPLYAQTFPQLIKPWKWWSYKSKPESPIYRNAETYLYVGYKGYMPLLTSPTYSITKLPFGMRCNVLTPQPLLFAVRNTASWQTNK